MDNKHYFRSWLWEKLEDVPIILGALWLAISIAGLIVCLICLFYLSVKPWYFWLLLGVFSITDMLFLMYLITDDYQTYKDRINRY